MFAELVGAACGLAAMAVDGHISDAEWGLEVRRIEGGQVRIAQQGSMLCLAAQADEGPRYTDVYLAGPDGEILNLHASMQTGIRRLSRDGDWDDRRPAFRWGAPEGWRANTVGWVAGVDPDRPIGERLAPFDGQEFIIDLAAFGPGPWRIRVELSDFQATGPTLAWPAGADRVEIDGWRPLD